MVMTRIFLDTSVIVSGLTSRNPDATILLLDDEFKRFTNEYVIKELRRVLQDYFEFSLEEVNEAIDLVREKCIVRHIPTKNELNKIKIKDKSDRPIVFSAMKNDCILVTEDGLLHKQAKKYVRTARPDEID